jgi:hypothetical protein
MESRGSEGYLDAEHMHLAMARCAVHQQETYKSMKAHDVLILCVVIMAMALVMIIRYLVSG